MNVEPVSVASAPTVLGPRVVARTEGDEFPFPRSPEVGILQCCARGQFAEHQREELRLLLREPIEWADLFETAQQHGMLPLLYWYLNAAGRDAVPDEPWAELEGEFMESAGNALRMAAELVRLLRLLQEHDIPAIPYKGPALAAQLYGNIALRQVRDLDILVHPRDLQRARNLLLHGGYRSLDPAFAAPNSFVFKSQYQHRCARVGDQLLVELHWQIAPPTISDPLGIDELWAGRQQVSIGADRVTALGDEDLLLVLCIHGSKHRWKRLEWICGVAELVRTRTTIDWDRVLVRAAQRGDTRMLLFGLRLANQLLEVPLPVSVLHSVNRDPRVDALVIEVCSHLASDVSGGELWESGRLSRLRLSRFQLACQQGTKRKARYVRYWLRAQVVHGLRRFSPTLFDRLR